MNDLNDMIKSVYDFFQKKYGVDTGGLGPGSLFFAFEKLPQAVAATDFKTSAQDPNFNPAVVLQHGSEIVNFMAEVDTNGFIDPRGDISPAVDEQYNLLINGALPAAASDGEAAFFLQLKGQAQQDFEAHKLNMNFTDFWPAVFTPQFWFNDQDPTLWTGYSTSTSQSSSTGSDGPALPTRVILGEWRWRVITPEADLQWKVLTKAQAVPAFELARHADLNVDLARAVDIAPTRAGNIAGLAVAMQPAAGSIAHLQRITDRVTDAAVRLPVSDAQVNVHVEPQVSEVDLFKAQLTTLRAKDAAFRAVIRQLPEEHVSSSSFAVSFDYCLVNVARPWLSANILTANKWYIPGLPSGGSASGVYDTNEHPFGYLPTKFLVVRNLKISAQWTNEDRTLIQNSASLGPFSLHDKSFDGVTLSCPGMQIMGWFCQIMPVLPPVSDPALGG